MAAISKLDEANLQAICDILGDTATGLTGSQIGRYLRECGCPDPMSQMTKRHCLYAALAEKQNSDGCANNILGFITHVMNPVRYVGNRDYFESERGKLNSVLEEVLSESLFLTHLDYSYGGTALLGALHMVGDSVRRERRERLERLILNLPKNARFLSDEPCDPMPIWLGHRLLVAGIALVSAFQYHFQGCRLQSRAKRRLPPRRKAGREVRAPAPGVLRYNRAVLQLKFVWIVK